MRGTCYLPIILPRRQSVCLWHDWEPREIAWHHFSFWSSRQRQFWHWEGEFQSQFYPLDGTDRVDTLPFAPCTKSSRKASPGGVAAAWKVEDFLVFSFFFLLCFFFLPEVGRCHPPPSLTPDCFCDSGHCKIQMFFPVWGKSSFCIIKAN